MDMLRPGGMAVHTTEFNLSSNDKTFESEATSFYRRRDMEEMAARLEGRGYQVLPFDWTLGQGFAETVIDLPPYKQSLHLTPPGSGVRLHVRGDRHPKAERTPKKVSMN